MLRTDMYTDSCFVNIMLTCICLLHEAQTELQQVSSIYCSYKMKTIHKIHFLFINKISNFHLYLCYYIYQVYLSKCKVIVPNMCRSANFTVQDLEQLSHSTGQEILFFIKLEDLLTMFTNANHFILL